MELTHKFPTDLAFQHTFELWGLAYNDRNDWICPAFNFAAALAQVSIALGRKHVLLEQGEQYPNFYQVILGHTHLAAKSPTRKRAIAGFHHIKRNVDPTEHFKEIGVVNSPEGLRENFATHENGDPESPMDWYIEGNGVRALIHFDELATLLVKSQQKATSGISVQITQMYEPDDSPLVNDTRQNKSYGVDWVANVFGCSTLSWYEKFLTESDFSGGFLNRFVFYLHEQQPIHARFKDVDNNALGAWQKTLVGITKDSLQMRYPKQYTLSPEAYEAYEAWYLPTMNELVKSPEDIACQAKARVASQVLKLSLVYAAMSNPVTESLVKVEHFESAKAVGLYWAACSGITLEQIDLDMTTKSERRVMERLQAMTEKKGNDWITVRELRQAINVKTMSSQEFNRAVESQIDSGKIEFMTTETGKKCLRLPVDV